MGIEIPAGEKGKRHALPHASIMIHRTHLSSQASHVTLLMRFRFSVVEPSGGASGQASDIAIHAKEILRVREVLTKIYQRHCAKEGEAVEDGVARFGKFVIYLSILSSCLVLRLIRRSYS